MDAKTAEHAMILVTSKFGHAAPILALAASVGWNARWEGRERREQLAKIVELLTQAGERMEWIESQEEKDRQAGRVCVPLGPAADK